MIQKLRLFLILPLFFYGCGVIESEYKPDIAIEIEHNLPVIDGVPTLTLNQNMWQNIHYIDFKVTLDGRPNEYSSFSFSILSVATPSLEENPSNLESYMSRLDLSD